MNNRTIQEKAASLRIGLNQVLRSRTIAEATGNLSMVRFLDGRIAKIESKIDDLIIEANAHEDMN